MRRSCYLCKTSKVLNEQAADEITNGKIEKETIKRSHFGPGENGTAEYAAGYMATRGFPTMTGVN